MFPKYVAALLTVWYSLSIIGFDVHSCAATGDTFVSSVLGGITCEDIHPEHDCSGHGSCCGSHECCDHKQQAPACCHDHDATAVSSDEDCCTNDIEVLDSEVVTTQGDDSFLMFDSVASQYVEIDSGCRLYAELTNIAFHPDSGKLIKPDSQAILNIWRI